MTAPLAASVITTFGTQHWEPYAKQMLTNFVKNWPAQVPILVVLDDDKLIPDVQKLLRPQDGVTVHNLPERAAFLERNKDKDSKDDYRKQACRFCHKVFALKMGSEFWKAQTGADVARYLIWLDADVLVTRSVTLAEVSACLPKPGDVVSYLGRKDWPHSECGWLAFDLQNGGHDLIDEWVSYYLNDSVYNHIEWHDSFIFDKIFVFQDKFKRTNLTADKPGMEIWPQSPMAAWSRHYKGPIAKQELAAPSQVPQGQMRSNVKIQTKNSIPDEEIQSHIEENQKQIKRWIAPCLPHDEEIVVVSAGPQLIAEDLWAEVEAGRKIVAVKHALEPLKEAGIKPWACILLDPRAHLSKFVENPDKDIIWFVASQVNPEVVKKLLDEGCTVWGYHAAVGANETSLTEKQLQSIVSGGSATATRGLFMLEKLGFHRFRLYGYELSFPDKPNMGELDELNQPKYFEMSVQAGGVAYNSKRAFWAKAEHLAQFEEFNQILQHKTNWAIRAFGQGMIPFVVRAKEVSDLRENARKAKLGVPECISYEELLGCRNKTPLLAHLQTALRKIHRKPKPGSNS